MGGYDDFEMPRRKSLLVSNHGGTMVIVMVGFFASHRFDSFLTHCYQRSL